MDNDTRRLKFKKTTIIVHFSQEIDEHGVVQTTARTDFLQKEPGICTPLTVEATWNSREAALQKLIHKVNALIVGGTLTYEELRFCPSEAMIYVTKRPKPADPLLDILPKLIECFKAVTQGDLRDQVPEIKKIEGELSNCLKKAQEKLETPQPVEMALNHIMTTIEASLDPKNNRPPTAILDDILHTAAKALLIVNYYRETPKMAAMVEKVVSQMEQREGRPT